MSGKLNVTDFIGKMIMLDGQKLVNNTGKEEFQPLSPVLLPSGDHTGTFTGQVLSIVSKKTDKLMIGCEFHVDSFGTVLYFASVDFANSLIKGAKYTMTCGEPNGEYSRIKKVEKAA